MAVPARIGAIQNLETTLEGIKETDGYHSTVHTVERTYKTWDDIKPSVTPWIGILPLNNPGEYSPGRILQDSRVNLYCFVEGNTADERLEALENLVDDIIKAVSADTTRGNNAVHTTLTDYVTDEGDPDAPSKIASMEVQLIIRLERSTSGT